MGGVTFPFLTVTATDVLISASVRENVVLGSPDLPAPQATLIEALDLVSKTASGLYKGSVDITGRMFGLAVVHRGGLGGVFTRKRKGGDYAPPFLDVLRQVSDTPLTGSPVEVIESGTRAWVSLERWYFM